MAKVVDTHTVFQTSCLYCGAPDLSAEPVVEDVAVVVCLPNSRRARIVLAFGTPPGSIDGTGGLAALAPAFAYSIAAEGAMLVLPPLLVRFGQTKLVRVGSQTQSWLRVPLVANGKQEIVQS
jgi:hypothetical protein